jgi:hypothetical protein
MKEVQQMCNYIELIEEINQDLYMMIPDENEEVISFLEETPLLELHSIGYCHVIKFLDVDIWCSEDDERPCINEETGKYMSLEDWIWIRIKEILSLVQQLHYIVYKVKG